MAVSLLESAKGKASLKQRNPASTGFQRLLQLEACRSGRSETYVA